MMKLENYNFSNKKVLVRVDYNVPLDENGNVTDDTRIATGLETIKKITASGGSVIIMTHLGRPKGKRDDKQSLKHILPSLAKHLHQEVNFVEDCVGPAAEQAAGKLKPGEVLLLENLRFHKAETDGDAAFAKQLAQLGDAYVNDAFATAHRAHASTCTVAQFFPNDKMFGYLIENEIKNIDSILKQAKPPFTAIMGGSKVSTKIGIIEALLGKVNNLILGGGIIYTFIKARGGNIGASLVEEDFIDLARRIVDTAKKNNVQLYLPVDCIAADKFANDAKFKLCAIDHIDDGWMGLDIGEKSIAGIAEIIGSSASILWNGPLGVFEMPNFAKGTLETARAVAEATAKGSYSLLGGGDTIAAINQVGMADRISYISTAGGALLEYIEGKELPGITAIRQ